MNEMKQPMVSVVIPVYNAERFLVQAVDSVLGQTYRNIEIILVDDCSQDESRQIMKEYVDKDQRVRLIFNDINQGVAQTRNNGIRAAIGEYIALLDSDDVWELDKLERQMMLMLREKADITYCSLDFIDEESQTIKHPFIVPEITDYKRMLEKCVFTCSSVVVKAELLKEHPFRTEYYHEDFVLWMELMALPIQAIGEPAILMHNRQVLGSRSNNKLNAAKHRWKIYRDVLGMNLFQCVSAFTRYAFWGIIKYRVC